MKRYTKVLAIFLAIIMLAAAFASCGRAADDSKEDGNSVVQTESPTPEATPEATPEPTPAATPEATESAEGTEVSAEEALGVVEGTKYTNDYFGFSIEMPSDWYMASKEELATIMNMTASYLKENSGASVDVAMQQILPLFFTASRNPFADPGQSSSIVCLGQNMKDYAALVTDVRAFLNLSIQGVKAQGLDATFGEIETYTVNGQEVGKISYTSNQGGVSLTQVLYATLKNDFAIVFTATGFDEESTKQIDDVMKTLSFK